MALFAEMLRKRLIPTLAAVCASRTIMLREMKKLFEITGGGMLNETMSMETEEAHG